jgi:hypothetical protein
MRRRIIVGIIENKGKWFCMTVSNFVVAGSGRGSGVCRVWGHGDDNMSPCHHMELGEGDYRRDKDSNSQ